jgi:hypothetical protein
MTGFVPFGVQYKGPAPVGRHDACRRTAQRGSAPVGRYDACSTKAVRSLSRARLVKAQCAVATNCLANCVCVCDGQRKHIVAFLLQYHLAEMRIARKQNPNPRARQIQHSTAQHWVKD